MVAQLVRDTDQLVFSVTHSPLGEKEALNETISQLFNMGKPLLFNVFNRILSESAYAVPTMEHVEITQPEVALENGAIRIGASLTYRPKDSRLVKPIHSNSLFAC